jgi:dephospho-CoA kinase
LQAWFDHLIVVYISRAQQIQRLVARDGITHPQAEAILAAQLPLIQKLRYADFIVRNDGTPEETRRQVAYIWQALTGRRQSESAGRLRP